jgi:hypothetical protein
MKKIVALFVLFLMMLGINAQDSVIIKSQDNSAIVLVQRGEALKRFDMASSRQQTALIEQIANTANTLAESFARFMNNFNYIISNAPPYQSIDLISVKTKMTKEEVEKAIKLKLTIDRFFNITGISLIAIFICFLLANLKSNWKYTLAGCGVISIIFVINLLLPSIITSIINYNYIYITEVLSLSG